MEQANLWLDITRHLEVLSSYFLTALSNSRTLCTQSLHLSLRLLVRVQDCLVRVIKPEWHHVQVVHFLLETLSALSSYVVCTGHPVVVETLTELFVTSSHFFAAASHATQAGSKLRESVVIRFRPTL